MNSELLNEFGDQRGPACLVAGANALAGIAVEVLVERNVVMPLLVGLEERHVAEHRTSPLSIVEEEA